MDAAVVRQLHNQAQEETKALRALEPGGSGDAEGAALALILSLASRIRALQTAVVELSGSAKGIWEQRTSWLHQELLALTTERLRPRTQGEEVSWDGIVRLVYACADNVRAAEASKTAAEAATERERNALGEANARATAAEERAAGAAAAAGEAAESSASREVLELRTKAVVQQQELQRRAADVRELQQRLQAVTHERDQLSQQVLLYGGGGGGGGASSNGGAGVGVQQLEASKREQARVAEEAQKLLEANHVLSVNLRQHADVVEKLIGLNAELMDKANEERAGRDPEVIAEREKYKLAHEAAGLAAAGAAGAGLPPGAGAGTGAGGRGGASAGTSMNGGGGDRGGSHVNGGGGAVGVSIHAGVEGERGDVFDEGDKPGWGKKVGKAWAFLAGDAPPVTPHVNTILADVPPV